MLALTLCTRLLKEALRFAVAGFVVAAVDPSCWINVCSDDAKLPWYWPAVPEPLAPAADATAGVVEVVEVVEVEDCAPAAVDAAVPPKPSAFNAANNECRNPCAACDGLAAAVPPELIAAASVAVVGGAAAVGAVVDVFGVGGAAAVGAVVDVFGVAAVAAVAVVAAAAVVAVAGVNNETAAEATGLAPTTTCSSVDNKLLNRP